MWDKILEILYTNFKRENELRTEQELKPLSFRQYLKRAGY